MKNNIITHLKYEGLSFVFACVVMFTVWVPNVVFAETYSGAGFPSVNIWYSKEPFFAGSPVRVYSSVFNSGSFDLSGTVTFFVDNKVIGLSNFYIAGGGRLQDTWADWTPVKGNHSIQSKITNAVIHPVGQPTRIVELISSTSGVEKKFVDSDSDNDGIGDLTDKEPAGTTVAENNQSSAVSSNVADGKLAENSGIIKSVENAVISGVESFPVGTSTQYLIKKGVNGVAGASVSFDNKVSNARIGVEKKIEDLKLQSEKYFEAKKAESSLFTPLSMLSSAALAGAGFVMSKNIYIYVLVALLLFYLVKKYRGRDRY
ncbi:MAG: hypothetical protein AAB682_00915 [Patescibacteria group bacterium]